MTEVQILNSSLNLVTKVKTFVPINSSGDILKYTKVLSDFGTATFRVSSYDPMFTTYGDVVTPHAYHVRIVRNGSTEWQGAVMENTKRTKDYIEVVAVTYLWYLGKILVNRTSKNPGTLTADAVYRIFSSNAALNTVASTTMKQAVTDIVNETITRFQTGAHALKSMTLGTVDNPNYPPNMTDSKNNSKTGAWNFGDGLTGPELTFDFHSILYILKSFGTYTFADFELNNSLVFNFRSFLGNDAHTTVNFVYGKEGNIVDFNITRLGQVQVNDLWGIATDPSGVILHTNQTSQASIQTNGFLEEVTPYIDIKDQGTLNARTAAELPLIDTPDSSANSFIVSEKAVPFGVYDVGDIVTTKVKNTAIDFTEISRIVAISVALHSTGRELTTIQTNKPRPGEFGFGET